ncbi:hypothetical protein C7374_105104 [Falsochrobactrum ovis]|uniref:Uncharacterized protein n=1 Tax=Falsochrobactrum ovis TaxID=1293442 RepID=A0A364JVB6_9HYPH|nr:hypothetical protein C7374_105104 [Falsochrobactrum ovis]
MATIQPLEAAELNCSLVKGFKFGAFPPAEIYLNGMGSQTAIAIGKTF